MSDNPISPSVSKQTRRFAPTTRGRGRGASSRGATARGGADSDIPVVKQERDNDNPTASPTPTNNSTTSKPIGHIRSETPQEGRLPSVNDGHRTRGGSVKMKFKPTIPARRNKKEVSSSAIDEALNAKSGGRGERGRGRGRGDRGRGGGRGRGRGRGDIIVESTASGLFSLGPSAMSSRARGAYSGGGGYATYGGDVSSRLDMYNTEASDMLNLFADNPDATLPVVFTHVPRTAGELDPTDLTSERPKIPWLRQKSKASSAATPTANVKRDDNEDSSEDENENRIKKEPDTLEEVNMQVDKEEDDLNSLPPILMDDDAPAQNLFALDEKSELVSLADGELLFFQLPTIIPRLEAEKEDEEMEEVKEEDKASNDKAKQLPGAVKKTALEDAMQSMTLTDIPEGQIGSLVVYKSGKIKFRMGDVLFDVRQGMQSSFLENVMMVDTESDDQKKMIELGHLTQKFVCMPDMDSLLKDEEEA